MVSQSKSVFIFGYSGHAYVVIESLLDAGYEITGYFDLKSAEKNPYNLAYFGFEKEVDVKKIVKDSLVFPTIGDIQIRKKMILFFEKLELNQFTLIDPSANQSKTATLGKSTYVGKNVIINSLSKIGSGVILNTACIVEHECIVGDYSHLAPSTVLCGNVSIGKEVFLGANSVIRQGMRIKDSLTVGAGSVIIKNLEIEGTWIGNPVRKL